MGAIEEAERHAQIAFERYESSHPSPNPSILGFIADLQAMAEEIRAHRRMGEPIKPPVNLPKLFRIDEIHRLAGIKLSFQNLSQPQLLVVGTSFLASYGLVSLVSSLYQTAKHPR